MDVVTFIVVPVLQKQHLEQPQRLGVARFAAKEQCQVSSKALPTIGDDEIAECSSLKFMFSCNLPISFENDPKAEFISTPQKFSERLDFFANSATSSSSKV
jgi:hypothetical protein